MTSIEVNDGESPERHRGPLGYPQNERLCVQDPYLQSTITQNFTPISVTVAEMGPAYTVSVTEQIERYTDYSVFISDKTQGVSTKTVANCPFVQLTHVVG